MKRILMMVLRNIILVPFMWCKLCYHAHHVDKADDSYINIFYTMSSKSPLEQIGDSSDPESWRAAWSAPVFWAAVDGKELDTTGAI